MDTTDEEEFCIYIKDTCFKIMVDSVTAEKMRQDHAFAVKVLDDALVAQERAKSVHEPHPNLRTESEAVPNLDCASPVGLGSADELCSPQPKILCNIKTPDAFKETSALISSTPASCSKALFPDILSNDSYFIEILNVPQLFMERTFMTHIRKFATRNNICSEADAFRFKAHDPKNNKVVIEVSSKEIASRFVEVLETKTSRFQNHTLSAKSLEEDATHVINNQDDDDSDCYDELTYLPEESDVEYIETDTEHDNNDGDGSDEGLVPLIKEPTVTGASVTSEEHVPVIEETASDSAGEPEIQHGGGNGSEDSPSFTHNDAGSEEPSHSGSCVNFNGTSDSEMENQKAKGVGPDKGRHFLDDYVDSLEKSPGGSFVCPDNSHVATASVETSISVAAASKIKVSGLPSTFDLKALKHLFNKKLWDAGLAKKYSDSILSVSTDVDFVTFEFANVQVSDHIIKDKIGFKYRGQQITVEPFNQNSTEELRITVSGIPSNFDEEMEAFLKFSLNEICWEAGVVPKGEEAALHVSSVSSWDTVVVQFINGQCVNHLILLEKFLSDGHNLKLMKYEQTAEELSITIDHDLEGDDLTLHEELKYSCHVQVNNVSQTYNQKTFGDCIQKAMEKAGFATEGEPCFNHLLYDALKENVIVKFSTSEEANLAVHLDNIIYEKKLLSFKKIGTSMSTKSSVLNESNDVFIEENNEKVDIFGTEGTNIFLKVMARFMDDIPAGGSHDTFLETILPVMSSMGVSTNIIDMRKRKAALREQFRRNCKSGKTNHPLYNVHNVIFNNASKDSLKGTFFEWKKNDEDCSVTSVTSDDLFLDDLAHFSEASSWTINSELALVQLFLDHKEDYNNALGKTDFWRMISQKLLDKKYVYKWQACQSKYNSLSSEYRSLCDDATSTGSAGPLQLVKNEGTRAVMEVMHQIKQYDVDANPEITMSAGVSVSKQVRPPQHRGRTRHPGIKRKVDRQERQATAEESQAQAIMLFAKAYAFSKGMPLPPE